VLGVDASGRGRLVAEWLDTYDLNPEEHEMDAIVAALVLRPLVQGIPALAGS